MMRRVDSSGSALSSRVRIFPLIRLMAAEVKVKGRDHQAPTGQGKKQEGYDHFIEQTEADYCAYLGRLLGGGGLE
ncbi:MAG: hypothetical protein D3924_17870 [Candidatus Electrothrix sp. AR4]|nr:hypothetical protein [Candidatus Electrothrix sp. AR4]